MNVDNKLANTRPHHLVYGYIRFIENNEALPMTIADAIYEMCALYFHQSIIFTHQKNYDTNGILYWLGTNFGTNENWNNPANLKLVALNSSGMGML